MTKKTYILEYWVDSSVYSKESLAQKLSEDLQKLDVDCEIIEERDYHVLKIRADKKNIDACHHHLSFNREDFFRAKDKLGDELRGKAYPILAELETRLRRFITRAMIEVLGFNWWDRSTPKQIRKNVSRIEKQSGSKQAEDHHQIEFTMFDDLIELVTGKYQKWSDTKNLTTADFAELLDDCETIEELKQELSQKRKRTSLWEDVFSYYFDDKEAWDKLEKKIQEIVIPIRHKVMHHRRIRIHDVREVEECRDKFDKIIGTAKSELAKADLEDAAKRIRAAVENMRFKIDPEVIQAIQRSTRIDPEIIKAIQQTYLIDPEIIRKIMSGFKIGLQDFDNDSKEDGENEREDEKDKDNSNEDEGNGQDDEENDPDNDADEEDE